MKEQFAEYDTSKMLKELGFDEDCTRFYDEHKALLNPIINVRNKDLKIFCTAPLWQQVKQWLWDKEKIWFRVKGDVSGRYNCTAYRHLEIGMVTLFHTSQFNSPIEPEIEAMKRTVKRLHKQSKAEGK